MPTIEQRVRDLNKRGAYTKEELAGMVAILEQQLGWKNEEIKTLRELRDSIKVIDLS